MQTEFIKLPTMILRKSQIIKFEIICTDPDEGIYTIEALCVNDKHLIFSGTIEECQDTLYRIFKTLE